MQRVAFSFKVKPHLIETYREQHRQVWGDMLAALQRHGWHNYSLFMSEDGLVFGYFEAAESYRASRSGIASEEAYQRWQAHLKPFFESIQETGSPMVIVLDEVFHAD